MGIHDNNRIPKIVDDLKKVQRANIEVGIFESDSPRTLMIARVHEYGVEIEVTESMRGYLASIGYPLRKETEEIKIPERSFVRTSFDDNEKEWTELAGKGMARILGGKIDVKQMLNQLGQKMVSDIQTKIKNVDDPPNSRMTVERKGSSNPLVDEGARGGMISKISHKVVGI